MEVGERSLERRCSAACACCGGALGWDGMALELKRSVEERVESVCNSCESGALVEDRGAFLSVILFVLRLLVRSLAVACRIVVLVVDRWLWCLCLYNLVVLPVIVGYRWWWPWLV